MHTLEVVDKFVVKCRRVITRLLDVQFNYLSDHADKDTEDI